MAIVRDHIPVVQRRLAIEPSLGHVRLSVATGFGGALAVSVTVESDSELERVKSAIEETRPPFGVYYVAMIGDRLSTVWCPSN
jgi:hypothetical protein